MSNPYRTRTRTIVAAMAAAAVTAVLASSLVESFEPSQLLRLEEKSAPAQIAANSARSKALPKSTRRVIRRHA